MKQEEDMSEHIYEKFKKAAEVKAKESGEPKKFMVIAKYQYVKDYAMYKLAFYENHNINKELTANERFIYELMKRTKAIMQKEPQRLNDCIDDVVRVVIQDKDGFDSLDGVLVSDNDVGINLFISEKGLINTDVDKFLFIPWTSIRNINWSF